MAGALVVGRPVRLRRVPPLSCASSKSTHDWFSVREDFPISKGGAGRVPGGPAMVRGKPLPWPASIGAAMLAPARAEGHRGIKIVDAPTGVKPKRASGPEGRRPGGLLTPARGRCEESPPMGSAVLSGSQVLCRSILRFPGRRLAPSGRFMTRPHTVRGWPEISMATGWDHAPGPCEFHSCEFHLGWSPRGP